MSHGQGGESPEGDDRGRQGWQRNDKTRHTLKHFFKQVPVSETWEKR